MELPSLWVVSVQQPQASSFVHWTWTGDSFHLWYYTCFNAILPNYPTLALSHRVQKTVIYICVSFTVSHVRLSLPYFLTTLILSRLIGEDLKIHYQIKKFTLIPSFLRAFFLLLCQCHIIQYFPSICYIYEYTIFLTVSVNKID